MKSILALLLICSSANCGFKVNWEGRPTDENDVVEVEKKVANDIPLLQPLEFNVGEKLSMVSRVEDKLANMPFNKSLPGYPPNKALDVIDACSCNKVLLSSLGPAATYLPHVMGTYTKSYTSYNYKPSYRQNYGSDYRMYFLPNSGWLIGDNRGAPTGYIHNSDLSQQCPYTIPSGWMFYSSQHGAWYPDNTLVLRCIYP